MTEPFVDFKYEGLSDIKIERVYSSADTSVPKPGNRSASPPGIFGRGWHHNWEAYLTCKSTTVLAGTVWVPAVDCTLVRGLKSRKAFHWQQGMTASVGTETWDYFQRQGIEAVFDGDQDILVKKSADGVPSEFVIHGVDGTELHFQQYPATDTVNCAPPGDPTYCPANWGGVGGRDVLTGGKAALTKAVSRSGQATTVSKSLATNVLLSLTDVGTGSTVELRSSPADLTLATRLLVNGQEYVSYGYTYDATVGASGNDLTSVKATPDNRILRTYVYNSANSQPGHLSRILGESNPGVTGPLLVDFGYDPTFRATHVTDEFSDVSVNYPSASNVLVNRFVSLSTASSSTHHRSRGRTVTMGGGADPLEAAMRWAQRQVSCYSDQDGRTTWVDRDSNRRVVRVRRFEPGVFKCSNSGDPTGSMPAVSDVKYGYGLERVLAPGVPAVKLDVPLSITQSSIVSASTNSIRTYDFALAATGDPAGYSCVPAGVALPAGSAPCRISESGMTKTVSGSAVSENKVSYFTYDQYARVTQVIGPISSSRQYADDVAPIETRSYYPADDLQVARRGRLKSVARSPSGVAGDGNSFVMTFDYVQTGISSVKVRRWYSTPQSFGEDTYIVVNDSRGRPSSIVGPAGSTSLEYFDDRKPSLVVDPGGGAARYTYGSYGRISELKALDADPRTPGVTPSQLWREMRIYDMAGNPTLVERFDASDSRRWSQSRTFDADHRPLKAFHPVDATRVASWEYDPAGIVKAWVDELGVRTELPLDPMGRPKSADRVLRDGNNTILQQFRLASYTWETPVDLVKTVTDGAGNTTTYEHDDFGRVVTVTAPAAIGATPVRMEWDVRSNLKVRSLGTTTIAYAYDGEDRLKTVNATSTAGAAPVYLAFTYDFDGGADSMIGRVRTASAGNGTVINRTTTFSWDSAGRLQKESAAHLGVPGSLNTSYGYNASGALTSVTYPSSFAALYVRDKANQVAGVNALSSTGASRALALQVSHEPLGPVRSLQFGNNLTMSRSSNARYEVNTLASGPLSFAYTIGWSGNVNAVVANVTDTRAFSYDLANRLTSMTPSYGAATPSFIYGYSGVAVTQANVLSGSRFVPAYAFGYDQQRNLTAVGQYNAGGSALSNTVCLIHDALGRLTVVGMAKALLPAPGATACQSETELATVTARFEYDAMNRRAARSDGTTWTEYVHDPSGNLLAELTRPALAGGPWSVAKEYVWLDGRPLAHLEYPGPAGRADGYTYYYHLDDIGLPRALTNEAGATVWSAVLARPYGDVVETQSWDAVAGKYVATNLRLPGQYDERLFAAASITGLPGPYYNWNRWYLPSMGRYMELDPIAVSGGFNGPYGPEWYSYVRGSPLRRTDRFGLWETEWTALFGPRNGNWGGWCWSGGQNSCLYGIGNAPPLDSGDEAYRTHDLCYAECTGLQRNTVLQAKCLQLCDRSLLTDLDKLDKDPLKWPRPPPSEFLEDTRSYCKLAQDQFRCSAYPERCK